MKHRLSLLLLFLGLVFSASAQSKSKELLTAVMKNNVANVETLLKGGADPNAAVELLPGFRTTYLITAATNGNLDIVKMLVQYKAQVDQGDASNETPLMTAAGKGNKAMVEFLLASGANVKAKDGQGKTVLAAAQEGGNKDVITLIEQKLKG
jgi:ankyrin repeat protein